MEAPEPQARTRAGGCVVEIHEVILKPDYTVYSPIPYKNAAGEKKTRWHRVGVGFLHENRKGMNVYLDSLPIDGKLSIFPADADGIVNEDEE